MTSEQAADAYIEKLFASSAKWRSRKSSLDAYRYWRQFADKLLAGEIADAKKVIRHHTCSYNNPVRLTDAHIGTAVFITAFYFPCDAEIAFTDNPFNGADGGLTWSGQAQVCPIQDLLAESKRLPSQDYDVTRDNSYARVVWSHPFIRAAILQKTITPMSQSDVDIYVECFEISGNSYDAVSKALKECEWIALWSDWSNGEHRYYVQRWHPMYVEPIWQLKQPLMERLKFSWSDPLDNLVCEMDELIQDTFYKLECPIDCNHSVY